MCYQLTIGSRPAKEVVGHGYCRNLRFTKRLRWILRTRPRNERSTSRAHGVNKEAFRQEVSFSFVHSRCAAVFGRVICQRRRESMQANGLWTSGRGKIWAHSRGLVCGQGKSVNGIIGFFGRSATQEISAFEIINKTYFYLLHRQPR